MKKRTIIAISLLLLLTTITSQQTIIITKLKLKQINIENNILIAEHELKKLLAPIYERNLIFLSYVEIERILMQNSFVESFEIKKKYPDTLKIRIFEKKPIAILIDKKKKYLLSDKIDLIDSTRVIEGYKCKYAVGNFRGRKYFAWYDPSVKTSYGPWKLHGLPGAIIFVTDSTKELSFKVASIESTEIQSFDQILKLKKLPIVARSIYREKREEVYNRMDSIKPEEGSGVTFDISIEKNYFEFE